MKFSFEIILGALGEEVRTANPTRSGRFT